MLPVVGEVLNPVYEIWWGKYQPGTKISLKLLYCNSPKTFGLHLVHFFSKTGTAWIIWEWKLAPYQYCWSPKNTTSLWRFCGTGYVTWNALKQIPWFKKCYQFLCIMYWSHTFPYFACHFFHTKVLHPVLTVHHPSLWKDQSDSLLP
jgi:hypothetical protein